MIFSTEVQFLFVVTTVPIQSLFRVIFTYSENREQGNRAGRSEGESDRVPVVRGNPGNETREARSFNFLGRAPSG